MWTNLLLEIIFNRDGKQCEHCVFTVRAASERSFPCRDGRFNFRFERIDVASYDTSSPILDLENTIFFSNLLKDTQIHILADFDEHEAEFYADFFAGDPSHFTLNMPSTHLYMLPAVVDPSSLQRYSDRVVDGIAAVFLALKRRPVLRYQRTYDTAKRIAHETAKHQQKKIYKAWKFKYKSILLRRRLQNPREQLEIVELQYMPYISSCIMSAADMAVVIQWFPGNRRPEHMTFYVIHYQLVYESKHVNSTLCLALQTSPATQRKSLLSQTLSDLQRYFATSNVLGIQQRCGAVAMGSHSSYFL
ncbi:hypothetical protein YC2023_078547 [Brassica napus]